MKLFNESNQGLLKAQRNLIQEGVSNEYVELQRSYIGSTNSCIVPIGD